MNDAVRKNIEGLKLYDQGKYEEALKKYNEAIEMDAGYAAPWINRSAVYRKLGREAEADDDMKWYESLKQAERVEEVTRRREAEASADMEKWESLKQAEHTEKVTMHREAEATADIEEAKSEAEGRIARAVQSGAVCGGMTLIAAIIGVAGFDKWNIIDAFIVFGLAFGVYKKSRVCAIILFVGYVGSRIWMMVTQPEVEVIWVSLIMSIFFGYWFFLGIIGTFAYHRIIKAEAKQGIPIEQSPKP